jgi:hypothetical protein
MSEQTRERNAWWFEPTEVRCRKPARVYRNISKVKDNQKAKKTTDTKVFRKPLCGPMQRYKLQHAMKLCFEVNFRFFDCCRCKVLGDTVDMKTKVSHSLCQTGLLANNVPVASQRSLA